MAQARTHTAALTHAHASRTYWRGIGMLTVLAIISAFGNGWDLYWHLEIGRDTFWIPPHTMMYSAVALSGLLAIALVLRSTWSARGGQDELSAMLGFRAPLGIFILGLGVLQMVISAPFDDWWHRVYGVDVSAWSPPHLVGFSGAVVMLSGLIIAVTAERQRALPLSRNQERGIFLLLALLFALVVRWITFLNSTTIILSWALEFDHYAVALPWAPWWGLWAGLCMAWIFAASARVLPGRSAWALPLAVLLVALVLRVLEFAVSAVGFSLTLPWGNQTLDHAFRPLDGFYDTGVWVTTFVLALPALVVAGLGWAGRKWGALRFGLACGVAFGLLLTAQFVWLRPLFTFNQLSPAVLTKVLLITCAASLVGGVIGAFQGDWLARFSR